MLCQLCLLHRLGAQLYRWLRQWAHFFAIRARAWLGHTAATGSAAKGACSWQLGSLGCQRLKVVKRQHKGFIARLVERA